MMMRMAELSLLLIKDRPCDLEPLDTVEECLWLSLHRRFLVSLICGD